MKVICNKAENCSNKSNRNVHCREHDKNCKCEYKCGALIDYDGHGYYANKDLVSNIVVRPSDIKNGTILKKYKYIMWFNR
jgi:hypothetical protein